MNTFTVYNIDSDTEYSFLNSVKVEYALLSVYLQENKMANLIDEMAFESKSIEEFCNKYKLPIPILGSSKKTMLLKNTGIGGKIPVAHCSEFS